MSVCVTLILVLHSKMKEKESPHLESNLDFIYLYSGFNHNVNFAFFTFSPIVFVFDVSKHWMKCLTHISYQSSVVVWCLTHLQLGEQVSRLPSTNSFKVFVLIRT